MKINSLYFAADVIVMIVAGLVHHTISIYLQGLASTKYICITGTQIVPDPSSVPTIPAGTEKEVVIGLLTEVRLQLDSWLRWLETEYPW